jgi:hypothetical protein
LDSNHKGEIHWGFADPTKYTGNITWHHLSPEKSGKKEGRNVYYKVDVDFVEVDGHSIDHDTVIMTDTGAIGIYPPTAAILESINKQIGEIKPDCSNRDTLPPFEMTIDGTKYTIPSSMYVLKEKIGPHYKCTSAFMASQGEGFWLMGDPFFRAVYAVLDVEGLRYGMAPNKNAKR